MSREKKFFTCFLYNNKKRRLLCLLNLESK
uniref:Uncharacterized protein n=1 Tax=Myoviridae sp. ctZ2t4 TaxID=2827693 RepID=A0A8S5SRZ0_9CAUD|nr:MAG TPA: hypothetical protein [Myoviridae sp. ctZ2t4]